MATQESGNRICEELFVAMVDTTAESETVATVSIEATATEQAAPVQQAAQATIEQTGADPPPGDND